jgi:hypothetical protein
MRMITVGCLALVVVTLCIAPAQAQRFSDANATVVDSEEELGEAPVYGDFEYIESLEPAIIDLKEARALSQGLRLYSYLTKVGGIAFDKVAVPASAQFGGNLSLKYDPNAPDGLRFIVIIDGASYRIRGYDWKLIPILKYANSPYYSCFSLFGTTGDIQRDEQLRGRHRLRYMCSYHPSFKNTLMGCVRSAKDRLLSEEARVGYSLGSGSASSSAFHTSGRS